MIGLTRLLPYRNVIILAACSAASASAGWNAQGWRMGRQLAETRLAHSQADVRRSYAATQSWIDGTKAAMASLEESRAALARAYKTNAGLLDQVRLAQPTDEAYACRRLALPETYLEKFHP